MKIEEKKKQFKRRSFIMQIGIVNERKLVVDVDGKRNGTIDVYDIYLYSQIYVRK